MISKKISASRASRASNLNNSSILKSKTYKKSSYIRLSNTNLKTKKQCRITYPNYCQTKESGGQQNTIFSIGTTKCAKKVNLTYPEILFYKKFKNLNTTLLQNFIPKTYGLCVNKNNNYIVFENLKYGFEKPLSIDIKFGFKTSNGKIMNIQKYNIISKSIKTLRHLFLDKVLSSSSIYGFRIEGATLDKPIPKYRLMKLNVYKVLYNFFSHDVNNKALNSFINKMYELIDDVNNNDDFNKLIFIGSSILFTYDATNPENTSCKLIDFNNTIILDNPIDIEKNKKHAVKTILAFNNLVKILEQLKSKI